MGTRERTLAVVIGLVLAASVGAATFGDFDEVDDGTAGVDDRSGATTVPPAPATTATTVPGPFPAIEPHGEFRAVETPAGFVLPVLGGSPGAFEVLTPCGATAVVDGTPIDGAHVVLDPGHGGTEVGAVGPSGLTEANLNLDIALRVKRRLEAEGAIVVLTRDRDVRMTLLTRGSIARSLDPLAFVSIHHNAAPVAASLTPGSEVYHQLADPESARLAGLLWEELQQHLAPFGTDWARGVQPGAAARRSSRTGDDYYGVLRNSQGVPAVLSEAAYLSHPAENALLETEEFRQAEADAIADAVTRLVTTDDPGSGFQPVREVATPAGGGGGSAGCVDPPL